MLKAPPIMRFLPLLFLLATNAIADTTPYTVASLVHEKDTAVLDPSLAAALGAPESLVRAAAARVITVRNRAELVPQLRERLEVETDATAAREVIRAIGLLGGDADIAAAAQASMRWPAAMDDALAVAVARRGAAKAIPIYAAALKPTRMSNHSEFFRVALWGQTNLIAFAGSRMIGSGDESGWRGLLAALADSDTAISPGVLATSIDSEQEGIRSASLWYVVRGYAIDPSSINALVKEKLAVTPAELSSDREDFARELLRRMLGGEKANDPRWLKFLAGDEADRLLMGETAALQYLTDEEYAVRYNRCEVQTQECALPRQRSASITIPSQPVAPPAFSLPEVLPAGLADAIVSGARCRGSWLGVVIATVDQAGRIDKLDLGPVTTTPVCRRALDTLLRLSLADNTSMRSAFSGPILLVRANRAPLCLDEALPQISTLTYRVGGAVQPPKVKKRVEPHFPDSALAAMGPGRNVFVVVEAVITSTGCVRNIRILEQSPYPALNGGAIMAITQWKFTPGHLDGKPVDVLFNLTINFVVNPR